MSDRSQSGSGPCMKPPALVVDFSPDDDERPSRASSFSDFEDVSYPPSYLSAHPALHDQPRSHHHTDDTHQLPLHHTYMSAASTTANEDIAARRRLKPPSHNPGYTYVGEKGESLDDPLYYDDEGKDVYSKLQRPGVGRMGSGRLPQRPPPPPTSLVRILLTAAANFI
jgi:dolichyl-phosphate-mannose-protein mannosyltransferase